MPPWSINLARKTRAVLLLVLAAICCAQAQTLPSTLPDAGYLWTPELAPQGPVLIVVDLTEQRAYVYRNGVRIAVSKVSTGRLGYETPTGVFTILEKHKEHYSNRYDNAPMPFMQRLTWDGLALHAGRVPERPASHGCVRLPYAFAERLFEITTSGMTVAIVEALSPAIATPGLFSRIETPPAAAPHDFLWAPERSPQGPLTIVLSTRDREVRVLRNAIEIGRAPIMLEDGAVTGQHAFLLLSGRGPEASALLPDRPAPHWLELPANDRQGHVGSESRRAAIEGRLQIDGAFAHALYDALMPGTTLLITDEPITAITATVAPAVLEANATIPRLAPGGVSAEP